MAGLERQEQTKTANHDHAPPAQVEDAGQAGSTTQFTNAGTVPPVNTAPAQPAGPSASDRAFGAHESGSSSHSFTGPAHLRVTADGLNVRSSPDASGKENIVGGVHHGDQLEADGRDGDWVCISFHGQRAFVHGKYVEAIPAKVAPELAAKPEKVVEAAKEAEKPAHTEAAKPAHAAPPDVAVTPAAPSPVPMPYPNVATHDAAEAPAFGKHIEQKAPAAHIDAKAAPAPAAPAAAPAAPKHADPAVIRGEYQILVTTARTGFLSTSAAVEAFMKFDRENNGGQNSPTGLELLATMPFDIAQQQVAEVDKKVPVKPGAPEPHPAPAAAATTAPAASTPAVAPPAAASAEGTVGHAVPALAAPADGREVGTDENASRGGPAGKWTPPPNAHLTDATLAQLGAQVNDPKATQILQDLAGVMAIATEMKPHLTNAVEAAGKQRENLVAGIHAVREGVLSLAGGDPKVEAFKVAVNHQLEALSPYYAQVNIRTLETGKFTECNLTSLAMSLSTVGKNADSYLPSKIPQAVAVAKYYAKDLKAAEHANDGTEAAWHSLRALRLADFMTYAAVATNLHSANPSDNEIKAAADIALNQKDRLPFMAQVAHDFGANTHFEKQTFNNADNAALDTFASQHHVAVENVVDARHTADASPENKKHRQNLAAAEAEEQQSITGGWIEKKLPLEHYKAQVMKTIKPLIDSGAGVVAATVGHFTHCFGIDDKFIHIQDPGLWSRAERKITWEEARALQYFWNYLVVR